MVSAPENALISSATANTTPTSPCRATSRPAARTVFGASVSMRTVTFPDLPCRGRTDPLDRSYPAVMRAVLVVNPKATATTAAGRDVLAHALASQVKLEVLETDYRGHAMAAAAQAMVDGADLVVAHGGDGTVN